MRSAALALALALASAAPALALHPITPPAPEFPAGYAWINSEPFSVRRLKGRRVTLIAFLNVNTAASLRTVSQLNSWWDSLALRGVMVIGVHSPDFGFDRDPVAVRGRIKDLRIRFPVTVDNARVLWRAYQASGWPSFYLMDHRGLLVYDQLGADMPRLEGELLEALKLFNGSRPPDGFEPAPPPRTEGCLVPTPAFYLGGQRGKTPGRVREGELEVLAKSREGELNASGEWDIEPDGLRYASQENPELADRMQLYYQGGEALAVLTRTSAKPLRVYLKQDNLWLHSGNANADVKWDKSERSYVLVDEGRLYSLTKNKKEGVHELDLLPGGPGAGVSAFEFTDPCAAAHERR